jgi:glyoxylase-like metal-dependent hydrolase (beta-lactamase superfamily II)
MIVEKLVVGPLQENCYIVGEDDSGEGIIIDPGDEAQRIVAAAQRLGLTVRAIVNTHGHVDHIAAAQAVKETLGARLYLHPGDLRYLPDTVEQGAMFGIPDAREPVVDVHLSDGAEIPFGALKAQVIHVPGHTPGGCLLRIGDDVFCGDLIFSGSIGRTDLPGGDYVAIVDSLERAILSLPDHVRLHPGHGPSTTVAVERRFNPFLQGLRARMKV